MAENCVKLLFLLRFWGRYHLKIDAGKMTTSFAISGAMFVSGTVHGNPFLIEGSWNKLQKPT